jgi:hypothetical protein
MDMPELPPSITVRASYAAPGGICPEELSVDMPVRPADDDWDTGVLIDHIIKSLANVPAFCRYADKHAGGAQG